jgi:Ras-related GTP-binding protein A/B
MSNRKKVLLMGRSGSGKTSMRSIIFANYMARDTMRLSATMDVEHSHVKFLGDLVLNLWDCGGQHRFVESYFNSQMDLIFRGVEVLIYVFDVDSNQLDQDLSLYQGVLDAIEQNSPEASIFVLVHKMDLVAEEFRHRTFLEREALVLEHSSTFTPRCFATSIWDETLYKAWSNIAYSLIPHVKVLEKHLEEFCVACDADEVVLFEKATFLVIAHVTRKEYNDTHRFERISNMIKQFKLSCGKTQAQLQGMEVRNSKFTAFIDLFTVNTYIMVVMSDPEIHPAVTQLNINNARRHFEHFIPQAGSS